MDARVKREHDGSESNIVPRPEPVEGRVRSSIAPPLKYDIEIRYHSSVNNRHRATLARIFGNRVPADLAWRDVEALLVALGAKITEGSGSRVRVELNGVLAVFHRPHPKPATDKGAVKAVRIFLENAGVKP